MYHRHVREVFRRKGHARIEAQHSTAQPEATAFRTRRRGGKERTDERKKERKKRTRRKDNTKKHQDEVWEASEGRIPRSQPKSKEGRGWSDGRTGSTERADAGKKQAEQANSVKSNLTRQGRHEGEEEERAGATAPANRQHGKRKQETPINNHWALFRAAFLFFSFFAFSFVVVR